jgi:terminase small subunit / prophage DNA-packing protein
MPKAKETTVSTTELADYLGLSSKAIAGHATSGIVKRISPGRFLLRDSVRGYCEHMRKSASGRSSATSDERARLVREQADAVAHKNAVTRGEYEKSADVETRWCGLCRAIRSGCLALSTRIGAQIAHLTPHDIAVIDREVRSVLTELGEPDGKKSTSKD